MSQNNKPNIFVYEPPHIAAVEVHKKFARMNTDRMYQIMVARVGEPSDPTMTPQCTIAFIQELVDGLPPSEKPEFAAKFGEVFQNKMNCDAWPGLSPESAVSFPKLMAATMDYVKAQPELFRHNYVKSFINDVVEAYNSTDPQEMSCVMGIKERLITSLGASSLGVEGNEAEYQELARIIYPQEITNEVLNPIAQKCVEDNSETEDVEVLKTCMTNKLVEQGFMKSGDALPPIVATYFADALPALIGGRRRRRRRSASTRKRPRRHITKKRRSAGRRRRSKRRVVKGRRQTKR
jgi:hypothetical protein